MKERRLINMSIIDFINQNYPNTVIKSHSEYGDETVFVDKKDIFEFLKFLKTNPKHPFDLMLDVCGVDYIGESPRFEVVYHLYSMKTKARIRIRVKLAEDDLTIPSAMSIWEACDWFEREAYEMFGIVFEGHPNLKRLLTWEAFEGYPLRKDYPIDKRQPIPEPIELV
jgi:NADH/F420H2 dehydrogenase subunit C